MFCGALPVDVTVSLPLPGHTMSSGHLCGTMDTIRMLYVRYHCAPLVGWSSMTDLVLARLHVRFLLLVLLDVIPALGLVVYTASERQRLVRFAAGGRPPRKIIGHP